MREIRRINALMVNGIAYVENRRRLTRMREKLREKWIEKRNLIWKKLIDKTDKERDPKRFWKDIGRMLGRKRKVWVEKLKNKNGRELKTKEEIETAF